MKKYDREIKAVVSDLDGTVIKKGQIAPPDSFFETVNKLLEKGIVFVAASGRQYANIKRTLAPIADKINYIAENGCLVIYQGKIIYKAKVERELALQLLSDLKKEIGTELLVSGENTSYVISKNEEYLKLLRDCYKNNVTVIEKFEDIQEDIIKISIWWKDGIPEREKEIYIKEYAKKMQVVDGGNGWLDFNAKGSGKGEALSIIAKKMDLEVENFVAFGDNENDITLLQTAGVGYAVESAKQTVKDKADLVCEDVETVLKGLFLK